jgi:hypothetical protein
LGNTFWTLPDAFSMQLSDTGSPFSGREVDSGRAKQQVFRLGSFGRGI